MRFGILRMNLTSLDFFKSRDEYIQNHPEYLFELGKQLVLKAMDKQHSTTTARVEENACVYVYYQTEAYHPGDMPADTVCYKQNGAIRGLGGS